MANPMAEQLRHALVPPAINLSVDRYAVFRFGRTNGTMFSGYQFFNFNFKQFYVPDMPIHVKSYN